MVKECTDIDHSEYYTVINVVEANRRLNGLVSMYNEYEIFQKYLLGSWECELRGMDEKIIYCRNKSNRSDYLEIIKVEDEWYIVNTRISERQKYYLCDQMYGLKFTLDKILSGYGYQ